MTLNRHYGLKLGLTVAGAILMVCSVVYSGLLVWFCGVPLLFAVHKMKPGQASKYGALAGATIGALLFLGLARYGIGVIIAICLYMTLNGAIIGLAAGLADRMSYKGVWMLFVPMVWVSLEFIRTLSPLSLPSNAAITQYNNLPLLQLASVTGPYGISFLIVLANCLLSKIIRDPVRVGYKKLTMGVTAVIAAGPLILLGGGFCDSIGINNTGIDVAIVQGSIPIELYRAVNIDQRAKELIRETYFDLTEEAQAKKADLIVWPEGVLGEYAMQEPDIRERLEAIPQHSGAYFLAGLPSTSADGAHNSVFVFSPSGKVIGQYDKLHLVPYFEEYKPGKRPPVVHTPLGKIGIAICFESIYPRIVRHIVKDGAEVLFLLTNDAGFGGSKLVDLHAREAVFRAVENRRYVVRAAQSGISMFIDPFGRILKNTEEFEKAILTGRVGLNSEETFYTRYGDIFSYLCLFGGVGIFLLKGRRKQSQISTDKKTQISTDICANL